LLEQRLEYGPLDREQAESALRAWWAEQPESRPAG
jgi:poly(A) polymerase